MAERHVVSKFCLEKEKYLHTSEFKYSLPSLHKYSLPVHRASVDTFLSALWLLFQNLVKLDFDQELK